MPTRNRPDLLRYCLESLLSQTFGDFEVIVSDNHTGKPCTDVFDRFADHRFRYVTPPSPLPMHDSWEFACSFATGEYVAVLIDKTILRPSALQIMHTVLKRKPAEIVSWWNEDYVLVDERLSHNKGRYVQFRQEPCAPYYFDSRKELERRFSMNVKRGTEGVHYYWGKICFGAYHKNLIRRIRESTGRLFHPACPDYTSMVAALAYANSAVDVGQPLLISFITGISTGRQTDEQDEYAFNWVKTYDPSLQTLERLPVKGLYTSLHNLVAADYLFVKERVGAPMRNLILNKINLILRAKEDLDQRKWQNELRRREQYDLWSKSFLDLSYPERVYFHFQKQKTMIRNMKRMALMYMNGFVERRMKWFKSLPRLRAEMIPFYRWRLAYSTETTIFENILEAAKYGDTYYRKVIPLQ